MKVISEIIICDRVPIGSGVVLMENKGNGFRFMRINGKPVEFSSEEQAVSWLLKE